jgi:hypothetical protein
MLIEQARPRNSGAKTVALLRSLPMPRKDAVKCVGSAQLYKLIATGVVRFYEDINPAYGETSRRGIRPMCPWVGEGDVLYEPPARNGSHARRERLLRLAGILRDAGWKVEEPPC